MQKIVKPEFVVMTIAVIACRGNEGISTVRLSGLFDFGLWRWN